MPLGPLPVACQYSPSLSFHLWSFSFTFSSASSLIFRLPPSPLPLFAPVLRHLTYTGRQVVRDQKGLTYGIRAHCDGVDWLYALSLFLLSLSLPSLSLSSIPLFSISILTVTAFCIRLDTIFLRLHSSITRSDGYFQISATFAPSKLAEGLEAIKVEVKQCEPALTQFSSLCVCMCLNSLSLCATSLLSTSSQRSYLLCVISLYLWFLLSLFGSLLFLSVSVASHSSY